MNYYFSRNCILLMVSSCILISCSSITAVNNRYNTDDTHALSTSGKIPLKVATNKQKPFHFTLEHDSTSPNYIMYIYWHAGINSNLLNYKDTMLKFLINGSKIITFIPDKTSKVTSYNLDCKCKEERIAFIVSEQDLLELAYANKVQVELKGYKNIGVASFTNQTFKLLRRFIKMSH